MVRATDDEGGDRPSLVAAARTLSRVAPARLRGAATVPLAGLAILALACAAWFFVRGNALRREELKQIKRESYEILATEQEPRRAAAKPGILAAALSRINRRESPAAATIPEAIKDYFDSVEDLLTDLDEVVPPLTGIRQCPTTDDVGAPPAGSSYKVDPTFGVGARSLCGGSPRFRWIVPAPASEILMPGLLSNDRDQGHAAARVWRSIRVALRIVEPLRFRNRLPRLPEQILQAYFISPDGIFSHVGRRESQVQIGARHPLHRWETGSYFQAFTTPRVDGIDRVNHVTRVYLDVAGGGLTRTFCRLIEISDGGTSHPIGIVCADQSIDPSALGGGGEAKWNYGTLSFELGVARPEKNGIVADGSPEFRQAVGRSGNDFERLAREVTSLPGEPGSFLLPVRRLEEARIDLLFVQARPGNRVPFYTYAAAMLCGLMGLSLAAVVVILRRNHQDLALRSTILRNLQVGVVEFEGARLRRVNDRAEELLGLPLPRFGQALSDLDRPAPTFAELFDVNQLLLRGEGTNKEPLRTSEAQIEARRARGLPSTYLARTRTSNTVVLVTGSPRVIDRAGGSQVRTFAVLRPADAAERAWWHRANGAAGTAPRRPPDA
ncbi:MAG: PAS domain-containing protein [Myxococcota bacterium]